jgi:phosphohistidine phosphatase SixA
VTPGLRSCPGSANSGVETIAAEEAKMPLFRLILPLMLLLLAGCMLPPVPQPGPDFYVMRHLHTAPGSSDPDLTPEGRRQAQLLANWFTGEPPAVIFVTDTKRARQTAAPLAAKLALEPVIYDPRNTPALIAELMKSPNPALIIGHSNTVPDIVAALGGTRPEPIAHDQFGDIWHVSGPRRTVTRSRLAS